MQKKINELEVGLLHLQQNIDIPEISLTIHNTITAVVKKSTEAGKKPTVEELGPLVSDTSFLNALQKDVSRWIREIQKVSTRQSYCAIEERCSGWMTEKWLLCGYVCMRAVQLL